MRQAPGDDDVCIRAALRFVAADWPLVGGDFLIREVYVTWPKKLGSRIRETGPLN